MIYDSDNYLTLDFETDTSHGDYGHPVHPDNGLLLACWKLGYGHPECRGGMFGNYIWADWGDEYHQEKLLAYIEAADFLVAHNAKYELGWLRRCGLDLHGVRVFDTKIAEYVLMGNLAAGDKSMAPRSTSLDACLKRRGLPGKDPAIDTYMHAGHNPVTHPRSWLQQRCKMDVRDTEWLFHQQLRQLTNTNRLPVLHTRCIITPLLAEMEFLGMHLDPDAVLAEYEDFSGRYVKLNAELEDFTGGVNWRSSKQLAEFLYDELGFAELRDYRGQLKRTKAGGRKTDKDTLEGLRATNKRQRKFLELRREIGKVNAALTKNLEFFMGACNEMGGTFHATFNQTSTATHRLSSSGIRTKFEAYDKPKSVQFQNLPRAFKPLFAPREKGWVMAEADGSQLEFRVAAFLSDDETAIADILSGHDVHRFTASVLNGVDESDVTKEQRQLAKPDTFKPLYGGQSGTDAQQAYYAAFRERYPTLAAVQEKWVYDVLEAKRLVTPWGLRYYWPYAKVSNSGYVNITSSVYNYPIQAFATAEIIPIAIRAFWDRLRAEGAEEEVKVLNTIHDSIICEVRESALDLWREIALESFTMDTYRYLSEVYDIEFDSVPLGVGLGWGSHWSAKDNSEQEYNVFRDGTRQLVKEEIN